MRRLGSLGANLVATFFMWLAVGLADIVTSGVGAGRETIMTLTILTAVGLTATLWLIWALDFNKTAPPPAEKSKRHAESEDARVALLLDLMGEDEREALKQRLVDELSGDGEAIPLAQLLDAQKHRDREQR